MCFPVKDKVWKAAKNPPPTYMLPFPPHIDHRQRQHFNINHSQVQCFSVFGKKSYAEVQRLRCMLLLPQVLRRLVLLLLLGVRWDQQQLCVKLRSITVFLWVHVNFPPLPHLSNTNWKLQIFSCHISHYL